MPCPKSAPPGSKWTTRGGRWACVTPEGSVYQEPGKTPVRPAVMPGPGAGLIPGMPRPPQGVLANQTVGTPPISPVGGGGRNPLLPSIIGAGADVAGSVLQQLGAKKQLGAQQKSAEATWKQKEEDRVRRAQLLIGILQGMNYPGAAKALTPDTIKLLLTPPRPYTGGDVTAGSLLSLLGGGLKSGGSFLDQLGGYNLLKPQRGPEFGIPDASMVSQSSPLISMGKQTNIPDPLNPSPDQMTYRDYLEMLGLEGF
jgi:hypothetical protein